MGKKRLIQGFDGRTYWEEDLDSAEIKEEGYTPAAYAAAFSGDIRNTLAASSPAGIQSQESSGTRASAADETLPLDMGRSSDLIEKMGFTNIKPQDKLFQSCKFPSGWTKMPHPKDHRTVLILDAQGIARGEYWYKAAFYDQKANGHFYRRFMVDELRPAVRKYEFEGVCVVDRKVKYEPKGEDWTPRKILFERKCVYGDRDKVMEEAKAWLQERHPNHEDVLAYWNE